MKLKTKEQIMMEEIEIASVRIPRLLEELKNGERDREDFMHELTKASSILKEKCDELANHQERLITL